MSEGIQDAVIIHTCGGIIGLLLQRLQGIPHGHADTRRTNHRRVVATIAECHRELRVESFLIGNGEQCLALIRLLGSDVRERQVPTP